MKLAIDAICTVILIAVTLTFCAYIGQYVIARDCGEHGQFRFGDLVYRCEVARWAQ